RSRSAIRDSFVLRYKPFERPDNSQRWWIRTFEELRGSFASLRRALKRSSGGTFMSSAIAFSAARLEAYCATIFSRFLFRLIWLVFAISSSIHERELEALEKRLGFFVGLRSGVDDDVNTPDCFRLVVVDFDENDVLFQAHRVVALAIERIALHAAEVAHAGQRRGNQAVEEFVHAILAQRDLHADRTAGGDLEGRNRLLRLGHDGLLAGDGRQVVLGLLDLLAVLRTLARADVQHDLVDLRNLERIGVAEFLHQLGLDDLVVALLEARHVVRIVRGFANGHFRALVAFARGRFLFRARLLFRFCALLRHLRPHRTSWRNAPAGRPPS